MNFVEFDQNMMYIEDDDGRTIFTANRQNVHMGIMGGGMKKKWFIYNNIREKDVGMRLAGEESKASARRKMKKWAKKYV